MMKRYATWIALGTLVSIAGIYGLIGIAGPEKNQALTVGTATAVAPEFAGGSQRWPDIAWGNGVYLVVWQEGAAYDGAPDANILAARISPEGKPLDPKGIVVCQARHHQT